MTQEITSLSYSKIASLLRCPKSFYFSYVLKIPTALPIRMIAGRVYHHCLAMAESKKLLFNEIISAEETADTFMGQWNRELAGKLVYDEEGDEKVEATIIDFGDDDPGQLKDSGIQLAQLYVKEILPKLEIIGIEKRLTCEVNGIPFIGYTDLLLAPGNVVCDHKLARRKLPQADVDKDLQISAYATLLGGPIIGQFHQALDTKEKSIHIVETRRGQEDIDWFRQLAVEVWQQIQSGIFPPNPLSWTCSESGCGYWMSCKKSWF